MSLATTSFALSSAGWRVQWNRLWRFSRLKLGAWIALAQLAVVAALAWRLEGAPAVAPASAVAGTLVYLLGWGFLATLVRGRIDLFAHQALPLVMLSPAPPAGALLAHLVNETVAKVWPAFLAVALVKVSLVPELGLPALLATWVAGVVAGALGTLAGTALLVGAVRVSPRSLGVLWAGATLAVLALAGYALYLIARGVEPETIETLLAGLVADLVGVGGVLIALCGGLLGLALALAPGWTGAVYRDGWLRLSASLAGQKEQRTSRWPALLPGAVGAIQAKEWLRVARNQMAPLRVWLLLAAVAGSALLGQLATGDRRGAVVLGAGVGSAILFVNELVATLFSAQGNRWAWYAISGLSPGRLLAGKLLAASPLCLVTSVCALVAGLPHAAGPTDLLRPMGLAAAIGAGMAVLMVGLSALDVGRGRESAEDSALVDALMEQVPRGLGGWAGYILATLYGVAGVWLVSAGDGPGRLTAVGLLVPPALALIPAYWRLGWMLNRHR